MTQDVQAAGGGLRRLYEAGEGGSAKDAGEVDEEALSWFMEEGLGCGAGDRDKPLLYVERWGTTQGQRRRTAEVMLENEGFPGLFVARDAVVECYAVGKSTAVVVDVAGGRTTVTPVVDGWVEEGAVLTSGVGGDAMDDKFKEILDGLAIKKHGSPSEPQGVKKGGAAKGEDYYELMCTIMGRQAREMVGKVAEFGFDASDEVRHLQLPNTHPYTRTHVHTYTQVHTHAL